MAAAQMVFVSPQQLLIPFPISTPKSNHGPKLNHKLLRPSLEIKHLHQYSHPQQQQRLLFERKRRSSNSSSRTNKSLSGIFTNMLWADLKAAFGQRFNLEGIICTAKVMLKDKTLALPQAKVQDIRWIDWAELHRRGFMGVVFDKDNTITAPYALSLWPPLIPSIQRCKSVFGEDNVAVFSNSAGLYQFDPDGSKAIALEHAIGINVIRHKVKKPAGDAKDIEKHFNCPSTMLVMVGDRPFTDVVYGNRNGFLTILTKPLCDSDEPFVVELVRKFEAFLVHRWCRRGLLKPILHGSLPDAQVICVEQPPPSN